MTKTQQTGRDIRISPLEAVAAARKLRNDISTQMRLAGLSPDDAIVAVVFAEWDLSKLVPLLLPIPVAATGKDVQLAQNFAGAQPIGFLVFTWDRASESAPIHGRVLPLIESPRSLELNSEALRAFEVKLRANLKAGGVNLPDEVL
jgi:hypothetical protein